jgi:hypothetical protein
MRGGLWVHFAKVKWVSTGVALEYLYLGIVGCVCRDVCMTAHMVGVVYIDEGRAGEGRAGVDFAKVT